MSEGLSYTPRMGGMARADHHKSKRHGNATKPSTELVRKARERGADGTLPADSRFLRSDVWLPLPGPAPVALELASGCKWPINHQPPYTFCNHPISAGSYCATHAAKSKPERNEL